MPPHELHYHLLDVFTREPFGGNQLAVFADATEIAPSLMPLIARELNLSETVFVLPPANAAHACRLRIFTPGAELPFAGHPTVGTASLLASLGRLPLAGGEGSVVIEEAAGEVRVQVRAAKGRGAPFAQLSAPQRPEFRPSPVAREALAAMLGIGAQDVPDGPSHAPAAVSCGVPFLFVELRDRAAIGRCRLDTAAWAAQLADGWAPQVFVFAVDDEDSGSIRARMFAPALGIAEDPATGAAATALAALLATRAGRDGTHRWSVHQGVEMGRPSLLEIEADVMGGVVTAARVGGHSVIVGEGTLRLPRDFEA